MPPLLLLFSSIDKVYCNITRRKKEWNKWLSDKLKLVNKVISYRVNGYWLHLCVFWKNTLFCRIWFCWELSYHYVILYKIIRNIHVTYYHLWKWFLKYPVSSGFHFENTMNYLIFNLDKTTWHYLFLYITSFSTGWIPKICQTLESWVVYCCFNCYWWPLIVAISSRSRCIQ